MTTTAPLVHTPDPQLIYRLWMAFYGVSPGSVLNLPEPSEHSSPSASIPDEFFRLTKVLEGQAISDDGRSVDYSQLGSSPTYFEYRYCASQLHYFDPASLTSQNENLAFWINVYNALMLDAVIQLGIKSSVQEVRGFFWKAAYSIGGLRYSSFDIEYGILRANRAYPAIPGAHFTSRDPRRAFSLPSLDPRIHFALVCAARSCPPIFVYGADKIDAQLNLATSVFINYGGVVVDRPSGEVRLSKIFQWYAPDFGASTMALARKDRLLAFIAPYMNDQADRGFMLDRKARVRFLPYDWTLNGMRLNLTVES